MPMGKKNKENKMTTRILNQWLLNENNKEKSKDKKETLKRKYSLIFLKTKSEIKKRTILTVMTMQGLS